jgi:hypothetical protein
MKKITNYLAIAGFGILLSNACYKDEGNYTYRELPDLHVDTVGIPKTITVTQFQTLNVPSRLIYTGDKSDLDYTWVVVYYIDSRGRSVDTLATTENLSLSIPTKPGNYTLEFTATNRNTGQSFFQLYRLIVEGAIGTGLLLLYEKNGIVDCDLIKTKTFVGTLERDTLLRGIFSRINPDYTLKGKPLQILIENLDANLQDIYLVTDEDIIRLFLDDMSIMDRFEELFFDLPEIVKPQGIIYGGGIDFIFNDGKIHATRLQSFYLTGAEKEYKFPAATVGDYYAAPYIAALSSIHAIIGYDQAGMRFRSIASMGTIVDPVASIVTTNAFDFDNVGKKMIYMGNAFGQCHAILKNPVEDGKRYLYAMNINAYFSSNFAALATYDISGLPRITGAELFTFSTRGPVSFYAVDNKVYRLVYNSTDLTVQPTAHEAWPYIPANEKITALQLMNHVGINVPESTQGKYLQVATYNETTGEGKVYLIQTDIVNGSCLTDPVAVYGGFGKIGNMAFKSL